MNITEKDLYKFVFYNSELPLEKRNFISQNLAKFSASIEFLTELKAKSEIEIDPIIIRRIENIVENNSSKKEFVLTPVIPEDQSDYLTLAADSYSNEFEGMIQTFADPGNNYLIKVAGAEDKNKLFLFSKNKEADFNLSFTLYPSNEKYIIGKSSSGCIVISKQRIDKIVIKN